MKFLCDNCKAKYQIADEKVAGKTVRMKCRKCGHQIEVRAAVTETSVSSSLPGTPGSDAPRPVFKSSLATSLSAAKPRAPMGHAPQTPAPSALAGAFQRTVQDAPQTVPFPQATSGGLELSVTDEWYVAINGVPVGPVRISELRRKAASGAVTEDSLCWQEGLEEWRPVRSIPELATIVREAAQGNRPSLISPPPNEGRGSSPPRAPQRPASRTPEPPRAAGSSFEPPRPTSPLRSNVVPLRVAATSNVDESPHSPHSPLGSPLSGTGGSGAAAALAPSFAPQPSPAFAAHAQMHPAPTPPPAPVAFGDPFAVPPAPAAASASADAAGPYRDGSVLPPAPFAPASPQFSLSQIPPQPRRGVPLWFWPILLFTGVFGVSAAVFVFRQPPQQAPVVIQMQPTASATAPEAKNDVPPPQASSEAPAPSTTAATKVATGGPAKNGTGATATPPEKKGGIDLGGLVGGAGGPNVGGAAGGPGPGGGGLDSASVERVVAAHRAGVRRTCWERGGPDQKSSVNVTVSATVAPDGSVAGTSSSGDDPVVAKCIEGQVRGWRFSAPGSTTTVNIPFKFVRQG